MKKGGSHSERAWSMPPVLNLSRAKPIPKSMAARAHRATRAHTLNPKPEHTELPETELLETELPERENTEQSYQSTHSSIPDCASLAKKVVKFIQNN